MSLPAPYGTVVVIGFLALISACSKTEGSSAIPPNQVGVAECDDFLVKYDNCIKGHVPGSSRIGFEQGLKQMRISWKKSAESSDTKARLAAECKNSLESAKASMATYRCQW